MSSLVKPEYLRRFIVPRRVIGDALYWFRAHGARAEEGLVWWVGILKGLDEAFVTRCVHPAQAATAVSVDVRNDAAAQLHIDLADRGEFLWAQVHSHPGTAYHSSRDDHLPTTHKRGFLSIVVPGFGRSDFVQFEGCGVYEYVGRAIWREWTPEEIKARIAVEGGRNAT